MKKILGCLLAVSAAAVAAVVIRDANRFVIKKYKLYSDKLKKPFHFVLLSDLHDKSYGRENEKLLAAVKALAPDAVLIAGDMITAKPGGSFDGTQRLIRRLSARFPVYYGSGNHEYRMAVYPEKYGDMSARFEKAIASPGLFRLHNDRTTVPGRNITVSGIEIDREFYQKFGAPGMDAAYIERTIGKRNASELMILIAHNPAYFPAYAAYGADLVLSGHVHGGIARLPLLGGVISPSFRLFPKYDGGLFREGDSVMIISRGLGMHTVPVRFLNPGELVDVTVLPEGSGKRR